ncbi:RDD family protein [Halalkalibacterium ligniniphilum]|uniref:RDD family protein n=1 Tax=Halalkalibacterium ligniniphilum TaxID=1134413 RepID=UPI00034554E0|nr:RDD family protein [Halalkalibacterium ligniniphilum]
MEEIQRPAGFWIRLGASILDSLVISIPIFVIGFIIGMSQDVLEGIQGLTNVLYSLIVPVIWAGYTVGKRVCGIRIVKVDGSNVGIGTMLLRVIVAGFVYVITLGIAAIVSAFMVAFRKDKRSVHDLIANTYVTFNKPEEATSPYHQN